MQYAVASDPYTYINLANSAMCSVLHVYIRTGYRGCISQSRMQIQLNTK